MPLFLLLPRAATVDQAGQIGVFLDVVVLVVLITAVVGL